MKRKQSRVGDQVYQGKFAKSEVSFLAFVVSSHVGPLLPRLPASLAEYAWKTAPSFHAFRRDLK